MRAVVYGAFSTNKICFFVPTDIPPLFLSVNIVLTVTRGRAVLFIHIHARMLVLVAYGYGAAFGSTFYAFVVFLSGISTHKHDTTIASYAYTKTYILLEKSQWTFTNIFIIFLFLLLVVSR